MMSSMKRKRERKMDQRRKIKNEVLNYRNKRDKEPIFSLFLVLAQTLRKITLK